jgi:hypothetical protein
MENRDINHAINDLIAYLPEIEASLGVILERERNINVVIHNMLACYEINRFVRWVYNLYRKGVLDFGMFQYVAFLQGNINQEISRYREYLLKGEVYYLPARVYFEIYPFHRLIYFIRKAPRSANSKKLRKALLSLHSLLMQRWSVYSNNISPNEETWWRLAAVLTYGNRKLHRLLTDFINGFVSSDIFTGEGNEDIKRERLVLLDDILYCLACEALKCKPVINCRKWL